VSPLQSAYFVEQKVHYPFHIPSDDPLAEKVFGTLYVEPDSEAVVFEENSSHTIHQEDFFSWEEHMRTKGYVLTPLIRRAGACVLVNIGTKEDPEEVLGCLISGQGGGPLFDNTTHMYHALVREDNMQTAISSADTLESMVRVGTAMYLNAEVIPDEKQSNPARRGKFLKVRLNVPNNNPAEGKLYVSGVYHKRRTRTMLESSTAVTFAVNPWDVVLEEHFTGPPESIIAELD
jgi:hypothetical protein